jgi:hypothetical protein
MPQVFIYALCEPDTGEIRYVGSSYHPRWRAASHVSATASTKVYAWCAELESSARSPLLVILGEAPDDEEAAELEARFISQFSRPRLLNARLPQPSLVFKRSRRKPSRDRRTSLGQKLLREEIARRGWSQNEAERQLGLGRGAVSRLLGGSRGAGLKSVIRCQEVFGISPVAWREPSEKAA